MRYEDLVNNTEEILKQICKFMLGMKEFENSKLEYIFKLGFGTIEKKFYIYDVETNSEGFLQEENIISVKRSFEERLGKFLKWFNYDTDKTSESTNWITNFNNDNYEKSVEFHEFWPHHTDGKAP